MECLKIDGNVCDFEIPEGEKMNLGVEKSGKFQDEGSLVLILIQTFKRGEFFFFSNIMDNFVEI